MPADLWPTADAARAAFATSPAAAALAADAAAPPPPPLDVAAAFLEHLLGGGGAPSAAADTGALARLVYVELRTRFVGADTDIHAAVQDRDEAAQRRILRAVLAGRAAFPVRACIRRASGRRRTHTHATANALRRRPVHPVPSPRNMRRRGRPRCGPPPPRRKRPASA